MAGHMGDRRVTTQNLEVVSVDEDRGLILVKGAVPGAEGGWVLIRDAVKRNPPENVPFPAGLREAAAKDVPAEEEAASEATEAEAQPEAGADEEKKDQ